MLGTSYYRPPCRTSTPATAPRTEVGRMPMMTVGMTRMGCRTHHLALPTKPKTKSNPSLCNSHAFFTYFKKSLSLKGQRPNHRQRIKRSFQEDSRFYSRHFYFAGKKKKNNIEIHAVYLPVIILSPYSVVSYTTYIYDELPVIGLVVTHTKRKFTSCVVR